MPNTLTRLLIFLCLGIGIGLVQAFWPAGDPWSTQATDRVIELSVERLQAETDLWTDRLGRKPGAEEMIEIVRGEVDAEVLFREGLKAGYHRSDPVVISRLIRNMQFVATDAEAGTAAPGELLDEAYALDMHLSDIVVRRRIAQVVQYQILQAARPPTPTAAEVRAHMLDKPLGYQAGALFSFTQIYVDPGREGHTDATARDLLATLERERRTPDNISHLGDPLPIPRNYRGSTAAEVTKRFGEHFIRQLTSEAEPNKWSGPFATRLGQHLVWLHQPLNDSEPAFDSAAIARARRDLINQRKQAMLQDVLAKLRGQYTITAEGFEAYTGEATGRG